MKIKFPGKMHCIVTLSCLVLTVSFTGCGFIRSLFDDIINVADNTNSILDQAVNDLSGNAANFETALNEAIKEVKNAHVKDQLVEALSIATKNVSDELKCNIQFTGDFLIKKIRYIKAEYNNEPLPVMEPMICVVYPDAINMGLPPNMRNNITISGYFLKENFKNVKLLHYLSNGTFTDQTAHLSISSDYKLKINLGSNGVGLTQNSSKLVLKMQHVAPGSDLILVGSVFGINKDILTEIFIIQKHPEPCKTIPRSLTGLSDLVLYPVQKKDPRINKKLGDREFDDNGPCVEGNISIFTKNNDTELWARGFVRMWECPDDLSKSKDDYSYGDVEKEIKLATIEAGFKIKRINISTVDHFSYIDHGHSIETIPGGGPVSQYRILGDTDGNDLGASWVQISFRSINVTLVEVGDCIVSN